MVGVVRLVSWFETEARRIDEVGGFYDGWYDVWWMVRWGDERLLWCSRESDFAWKFVSKSWTGGQLVAFVRSVRQVSGDVVQL